MEASGRYCETRDCSEPPGISSAYSCRRLLKLETEAITLEQIINLRSRKLKS